MKIIKYVKLPFRFDAEKLRQEVDKLSDSVWVKHFQKLHYSGDWSAIPLRSIEGKTGSIFKLPEEFAEFQDTVFLKNSPYFVEILKTFQCPLQTVRLLKLSSGAIIKEHKDVELNFESGEIRLHIPIITHEDVEFYLQDERIFLREGECWYLNVNLPHSVENKSDIDRIHLVIDAKVNDWVKDLFATANEFKKEIEPEDFDIQTKQQIIQRLRLLNTETSNQLADEMEASLN